MKIETNNNSITITIDVTKINGSEKQLAWIAKFAPKMAKRLENHHNNAPAVAKPAVFAKIEEILENKAASWWIDHRDWTFSKIMNGIIRQNENIEDLIAEFEKLSAEDAKLKKEAGVDKYGNSAYWNSALWDKQDKLGAKIREKDEKAYETCESYKNWLLKQLELDIAKAYAAKCAYAKTSDYEGYYKIDKKYQELKEIELNLRELLTKVTNS